MLEIAHLESNQLLIQPQHLASLVGALLLAHLELRLTEFFPDLRGIGHRKFAKLDQAHNVDAEIIRRGLALDCRRFSHGRYRALEPEGVREIIAQAPYCDR